MPKYIENPTISPMLISPLETINPPNIITITEPKAVKNARSGKVVSKKKLAFKYALLCFIERFLILFSSLSC